MTETERIDGRIRDLAELCTRHGTPCAGGLLAEIGRLRTDIERSRTRALQQEQRAEMWKDEERITRASLSRELERTEGDLGVAIREAAAAREALREVWRIQAKYGPWGAREKIELVVSAALDQRLAPDETEESPDDPTVMLSLIDDQADQIESLHGRIEGQAATISALRVVARYAANVMENLEVHGPGIVGHLLDDDDNEGQRLREALRAVSL